MTNVSVHFKRHAYEDLVKKCWPFVQVIISSLAPHLHPVMSEWSSPAMRSGKAGAAHLSSPSTLYAAAPACLLQ